MFMVFAVDAQSMRAMVTGRYDPTRSPEARHARPFGRGGPEEPSPESEEEASS